VIIDFAGASAGQACQRRVEHSLDRCPASGPPVPLWCEIVGEADTEYARPCSPYGTPRRSPGSSPAVAQHVRVLLPYSRERANVIAIRVFGGKSAELEHAIVGDPSVSVIELPAIARAAFLMSRLASRRSGLRAGPCSSRTRQQRVGPVGLPTTSRGHALDKDLVEVVADPERRRRRRAPAAFLASGVSSSLSVIPTLARPSVRRLTQPVELHESLPIGNEIVLRRWLPEDAPSLAVACDDAEIARWLPMPSPYTTEAAQAYLALVTGWWERGDAYALAIADGLSILGAISIKPATERPSIAPHQ
jgi:hypothetical protein